ncbi:MAG: methyl-accepting chemotaxis protein, partial [Pseudanabaena sp. ELA748]
MASTPKKKQVASLGKKEQSQRSPKSPIAPKSNKSKSSMGLDLLLIAIGTSLIGLGVLGYLFYQELLSSTRREVDRSAEAQTRQLETKLAKVQQTVDGVASGAKVLSQQQPKPKSSSNYQGLLVDGLQSANTVAGIGISSNNNLLFPNPKPTVPYVWREQSGLKTEIAGQKLPVPNDKFLSTNRLDIQKAVFYQPTIKGKASWSQPYTALGKNVVTYSAPIVDGTQVLGIVNADAIATELLSLTATPSPDNKPDNKMGFVVVEASGKVITASSPEQNTATDVLANLASQAKTAPTGIIQTGGNLWAYRKVTGSDWLVVAYVPESEIINKLLVLVGGAAIGISAILAIAVLAFVNSLKKRLQPLSEECDRFLSQQGNPAIVGKDEIERLGLSLKSTFQQVKANEIRLRSELVQGSASEDESTAIQQNIAETQLMEAEVGDLLDVVSSMEEGNLTIEAQVNDRATGLVADTLNRLREKLVEIISSVLGTAQQVAQGASDLEELARTVVLNTAEQAQSVSQGQALTEQVAAIAARSVSQVNVANQSLQEVRDTVASGQTAINTLTDSISVLQIGSAQIVQRMKTLGEFVGLAEQFVQDQGQIASLTQVLALNATLVAARAAEQKDPKQFTSVAREFEAIAGQVNDLATQTNDGLTVLQQRTSQIQTVVTAIDTEVQNLSGLVAGFTAGVEASQSAFDSIQGATAEVVQIGLTITASSTEIAEAAGSTATYISEIAQLADRTADLTRSARQQAEAMGNQAQQLLQGIQFFQLPEGTVAVTPAKNIPTATSVNDLNNVSDAFIQESPEDNNLSLGLAVPVLGTLAAAVAATVAISQAENDSTTDTEYSEFNLESDGSNIDHLVMASDGMSLEDYGENPIQESYVEEIPNPFTEDPATILTSDSEFLLAIDPVSNSEMFSPESRTSDSFETFIDHIGDQRELLPSELTIFPELNDISIIEESLLADLKQEVYNESISESISESI